MSELKSTSDQIASEGWQASLELDGTLCETREQADAAARLLGWVVEEEIAAEHGLWMVTITQAHCDELHKSRYLEIDVTKDGYTARGEIELP